MPPDGPANQFDYVFVKGEGNKGASYKYTWRPDWKMAPGVKPLRVFLAVSFWVGLAAIPVYVWPYYYRSSGQPEEKKKPDVYAQIKQRNREERMKWIQAPDMPPR